MGGIKSDSMKNIDTNTIISRSINVQGSIQVILTRIMIVDLGSGYSGKTR